ncbi:B12-binding domain-containing radical SAM protein [Engelhardtia mirabilis]|uniref:(Dimethylallyl)adenosine tRNA methylthiotransferase MiaB n=1 Tax=Engelhardtia mirabilis TaxID=2528011 RepID=A0A518BQR4_9BACT|nr:(Dimethylallyl)adenosine tRNA methylthiotransferase MiaB [Planctomycetes bacterium Pla133]QDV03643.1 (Dimethylallyl)adenosine tRNA methylthiotransferase MiaB [Planctomycetes bacterium Pla86]
MSTTITADPASTSPARTERSQRPLRTVLVQTYHPYTQFTHVHPLGIMMIAANARERGHKDVHLVDMKVEDWTPERACQELERLKPDVVGLSAMTYEAGCMHELAKLVRARLPKAVIVCGGPHPSVAADDVMEDASVDFVVRGEGEETFAELLDGVADGRTDWSGCAGIHWRDAEGKAVAEPDRPPPADLDAMPFPAWDLVQHPKYHKVPRGGVIYAHKEFATMFSSRACPWRCTYCHNSYGKAFRERSAENVLEEMRLLVEDYGVREFVFMDDIFNFRPERAKKIARGIIDAKWKIKLTFPNGFRGDILDEELVVLLKEAGMYRCMIAVESAVPRIQKVMKKNLKIDKVRKIVEFTARQGVMTHGAFMLGFPTETEEEMEATIEWAASSAFHTAAFFRVIPFKGTELFNQIQHAGFDLPTDWSKYEPYQSQINLSEVEEDEIYKLRKKAYRRFYWNPRRLFSIFRLIPNKTNMLPFLTLLFARRAYAR